MMMMMMMMMVMMMNLAINFVPSEQFYE